MKLAIVSCSLEHGERTSRWHWSSAPCINPGREIVAITAVNSWCRRHQILCPWVLNAGASCSIPLSLEAVLWTLSFSEVLGFGKKLGHMLIHRAFVAYPLLQALLVRFSFSGPDRVLLHRDTIKIFNEKRHILEHGPTALQGREAAGRQRL